jgi:hypothetical protein
MLALVITFIIAVITFSPFVITTQARADEIRQLVECVIGALPCPITVLPNGDILGPASSATFPLPIDRSFWSIENIPVPALPLDAESSGTVTVVDHVVGNTWISTRGSKGFWVTVSEADQDLIDARAICADHRKESSIPRQSM